jgi:hypothetical protein
VRELRGAWCDDESAVFRWLRKGATRSARPGGCQREHSCQVGPFGNGKRHGTCVLLLDSIENYGAAQDMRNLLHRLLRTDGVIIVGTVADNSLASHSHDQDSRSSGLDFLPDESFVVVVEDLFYLSALAVLESRDNRQVSASSVSRATSPPRRSGSAPADEARGPTQRDRQKQATRETLRSTAVRLFVAQGFRETTTEEIAAAAGVSRRTFFLHFASKDEVLLGHIGEELDMLRAELDTSPASLEPAARAGRQSPPRVVDAGA